MITEQKIQEINAGRYLLGVTGSIGCGKTYASEIFGKIAENQNISTLFVNVDCFRRVVLGTDIYFENERKMLVDNFGKTIQKQDGSICGKELGQIIFYDPQAMEDFRSIICPAVNSSITDAIKTKNGLLFIEWACLVEDGLLPLVEGNVLVAACNYQTQIKRLSGGDLPIDQIEKRIAYQLNNSEIIEKIQSYQNETMKGNLYLFDTTFNPQIWCYEQMLEKIIGDFK
jgi:dephospho-CoA kinase